MQRPEAINPIESAPLDCRVILRETAQHGMVQMRGRAAGGDSDQGDLAWLSKSNVTWNTPSRDSMGSMPLGNGDIGLNLWVEEGGDLLFYISKTDAFDGNHVNRKLGRLRITLKPNPFTVGLPFNQTLDLQDASISIRAGKPGEEVSLKVWVDANHPVIRVCSRSD
ncbi:MAG: DUF5703 domain-containing protein, partial [bacterium]